MYKSRRNGKKTKRIKCILGSITRHNFSSHPRQPVFEDKQIVWAKLGSYRWWPAQIIKAADIPGYPTNHENTGNGCCVKFLGTNKFGFVIPSKVVDYSSRSSNIYDQRYTMRTAYARALSEAHALMYPDDSKPPPYQKIRRSVPFSLNVQPNIDKTLDLPCRCSATDASPCGPNSQCLNRALKIACTPQTCPAKEKCENQYFYEGSKLKLVAFKTDLKGWGLKTMEQINENDFIIEFLGEILDEEEFARRLRRKNRMKDACYYLMKDGGMILDVEYKGNLSRFINHSCRPNAQMEKWAFKGETRFGIFALRDIAAEEEITINYRKESNEDVLFEFQCKCGEPNCLNTVKV